MSDSIEKETADELLDKNAARRVLGGIGATKFYQLLASGDIAAHKIGRRTFIKRSELNRYLACLPAYGAAVAQDGAADR